MKPGFVRIIAGKWRGRRLQIPEIADLRPTPDRVRETLFNWLSPILPGAHCLDVFAGTGVLGFEALSRGAASVVLVDQSIQAVQLMQAEMARFNGECAEIYCAKAPEGLKRPAQPFDVVFLDPPYQSNLLLPCCHYLEENQFLANDAYIYLEAANRIEDNELPPNWRMVKSHQAGQVAYHLARRGNENE